MKNNLNQINDFKDALPSRCKCALEWLYDEDIYKNPQKIVDNGPDQFKFSPNFGPYSLRCLAETLHQFGYLDDPDKWLGG